MQLLLLQDEQVIETLATHAALKTFTDGIGARSVKGCFQDLDAAGCCHARETGSELGITIMDEIRAALVQKLSPPVIVGQPRRREGNCDADVDHS